MSSLFQKAFIRNIVHIMPQYDVTITFDTKLMNNPLKMKI